MAFAFEPHEGRVFGSQARKKARAKAHQDAFAAAEDMVRKIAALSADPATVVENPTPTFKTLYAALVQFHLTEWLFPADDPELDEGVGEQFAPHKGISEAEEDDDDEEDDLEGDEEDDDEALE